MGEPVVKDSVKVKVGGGGGGKGRKVEVKEKEEENEDAKDNLLERKMAKHVAAKRAKKSAESIALSRKTTVSVEVR